MKYLFRLTMMCIFCVLILSSIGNSAIITFSDGSTIETEVADKLNYSNNMLKISTGTETLSFERKEIKNISFAAQTRKKETFNTDVADLPVLLEKAQKLINKYSDARSITVIKEYNHQYRKDGTSLSRYRSVTYIAQESALWTAQISLGFDPNRETVKVLHARSYSPDGKVISLSPEQIKVVKGTSGSSSFSNRQQISFSIPEATIGGLIDYCYEIEKFNPFDKKLFQGAFFFQGSQPVGKATLRVSVPNNTPLYHVTRNCDKTLADPKVIEAVDSIIYSWYGEDFAPIVSEPYMPAFRDVSPAIYYSLHKDFTYIQKKLKPMFNKRFKLTDLVKQKVDELIEGSKTIHEKIAKLYQFCQKDIRYISIKGNLASSQVGHPAEETLKNRYGDCTDKAMLLATMLKHIGVEAYSVGVLTNNAGRGIRDIGIFDDNHCITEIHLDGRIFYLDSTASDYRYPYFRADNHDTSAENTVTGTIRNVPMPPPEDNAITITRNIELKADGTTRIDFESIQNGSSEAGARGFANILKAEEYEKQIRQSVAALTADYKLELATHTDPLDFSIPFKSRSIYTLNRFATKSGKYMIFSIPFFEMGFPEVSLENRKYNIEYTTSRLRIDHIEIKIPEDFNVEYLPPALRIQSPYVEFEVIYDQQGSSIKVSRKIAFPRRIIPVGDYKSFKQDLEKISLSSKKKIFLVQQQKVESEQESTSEHKPGIAEGDSL